MQRLEDLPVAIDLPDVLAQEVSAFVEAEAGWQVVSAEGPPAPVLHLRQDIRAGLACVVVCDGVPAADQVRAALLGGALDIVAWPQDRARLLDAPLRLGTAPAATVGLGVGFGAGRGGQTGPGDRILGLPAGPGQRRGSPDGGPVVVRVAGATGGAGTSTVALAIAGLLAWTGRATLVVGDDDLLRLAGRGPWLGPGAAEIATIGAAQGAAEVAALAVAVPGVPRLAVLGGGGIMVTSATTWPVAAVVCDLRAGSVLGADLLVARPDGGLRAIADGEAPVVCNGQGPLDRSGVRRALGRAPAGWLPASARVARAGVVGRVPSGLPGTWMADLRRSLGAALAWGARS